MSGLSLLGVTAPGFAVVSGAALVRMGLPLLGALFATGGLIAWVYVENEPPSE
ncbi:hypothetical protein [Haloarcula amylovorans]|uniref:hypothetical protein n=1 Tax=Haloarcula amylovorans TaxID=2562280 RepID=UPI00142FAE6F|nr:hypothetical protein [Halomicroarcula amylolytica]